MSSPSSLWTVESCRVSFFTMEMVDSVDAIFAAITGQPPDTSTVNRQIGQSVALGPWKAGVLQVSTFPGRVDFGYGPQVEITPGVLLLDGSPAERFQELIEATSSWVSHKSYKINRIAIGSRNLHISDSVKEAYELFSSYVRLVKVDYPRTQEIQLRANQQTESKLIPGLTLNRVSTWNVITFHIGSIPPGFQPFPLSNSYYLVSDIDFNSAADRIDPIPNNSIPNLLSELLTEVEAVLDRGIQ